MYFINRKDSSPIVLHFDVYDHAYIFCLHEVSRPFLFCCHFICSYLKSKDRDRIFSPLVKMDTNEKENAILPQNKAIVIIRRSVNLVMPMALAGK